MNDSSWCNTVEKHDETLRELNMKCDDARIEVSEPKSRPEGGGSRVQVNVSV